MMNTADILKKVKKVEIKSKGISNHIFSGAYHSAFKGRGMSFSEVREYIPGDDVRAIDWNVTARYNTPFVKVFEEERELTLMLLVDISYSTLFGSSSQSKKEIITEIAAVLAFSAASNNDKVGLILFSEGIDLYIPPKKGKSHILRIIRELIATTPKQSQQTNIDAALTYFNKMTKRRTIAVLISDFMGPSFEHQLKISSRKHDFLGIQVFDKVDKQLPNVGLIAVKDRETGHEMWIDTADKNMVMQYEKSFLQYQDFLKQQFRKQGATFSAVQTDQDYIRSLRILFGQR